MPSNKETLFQDHICSYLEREHGYQMMDAGSLGLDSEHHIAAAPLIHFIQSTQPEAYASLVENYGTDADTEILKKLNEEASKKPLWLLLRHGIDVRGTSLTLYKPAPRSQTSTTAQQHYAANQLHYQKEYRYNPNTGERIDLVIWLNGLPIIVTELKHEDEGQTVEDAVVDSFLNRNLTNNIYKHPFLYVAASDCQVKVATDPSNEKNFRWFNAQLINQAETDGEYPVEHLYRDAFSKSSICQYLEHFLLFIPAQQTIAADGYITSKPAFTIFPRYHQIRASRIIAQKVKETVNQTQKLGKKYLIDHSAGSGKTLTIAWMADQLDSLYDDENNKIFDNIIILTDRKSLDKNVKDDLDHFTHLKSKVHFAKKSSQLADHLIQDRDIIVTTIHKFNYIQNKLTEDTNLRGRKIAFLIDEAHRSQEGRMALTMRQMFTTEGEQTEEEEEAPDTADGLGEALQSLDIHNQVFVAFTATATQKTIDYFGAAEDIYSEREAIDEGYILDTAQSIISYKTLFHIDKKRHLPTMPEGQEFPAGTVAKALKQLAFNDLHLIQYKSEVMIKLFLERVQQTVGGKGKAMIVASSRPAGLKYYNTITRILEEKKLPFKTLFAFSDFTDPDTGRDISEDTLNGLSEKHGGKLIEEVFDQDDHRILIVANKFQTGFDQPLLSGMFLDKSVNGVTAIQTVSRLNRKHPDKEQDDILVVDFTNNSEQIFKAFNKHREGSPYQEKEPDPAELIAIYEQIKAQEVFSEEQITRFATAYIEAEQKAYQRESEMDALLSNITQEYRAHFETSLSEPEDRKQFIADLKRFSSLYYFIAKFFQLPQELHQFIIFADGLADRLLNRRATSALSLLLKNLQVTKGAVTYMGDKENPFNTPRKPSSRTGGGGSHEVPLTTIELALEKIIETHEISDEDAIIIREICEEVAEKETIQTRVIQNKDNATYLKTYEPTVQQEIKTSYILRELWDKLQDPIYIDQGGIITIMGKSIIDTICESA